MATGAHFQINQATNPVPSGTVDFARIDLRVGQLIHFVADSSGGQTLPAFTIVAYPRGSARTAITSPNTYDASYTPDVPGSYLIQFNVGDGVAANTMTRVFACTADANGIVYDAGQREPAFQEAAGHDNTSSNDRGFAQAYETSLAAHLPRISTHAVLLNARASKHKQVYLSGFYADHDGGEGIFFWDSASTTAHVTGMILQPGFGTGGAMATGRWVRQFDQVNCADGWFGMKPDDPAVNNAPLFQAALNFTAGRYRLLVRKGLYWFWQVTLPSDLTVANTTCNVTFPSQARVRGAGRGVTIFRTRTPLNTGGGDPTVPADIPMIPHTRTAMLRSHTYAGNSFAFVNGHSYYTASGGTTSANPSDAPTGVFLTPVVDGTVSWEFADTPFRGGVSMQCANNALDVILEDFTLDGGCPWVDNVSPPPYRLSGTYLLYTTPPASVPLMYAEKSYNQVTYAYGWDVFNKGFNTGDSSFAPQGIQRLTMRGIEITRFRGELFYDSGYDLSSPNNTIEVVDSEFSEGPTSFSSFAGGKFIRCRFRHLDQAVDISRGIADLEFNDCDFDDCRTAISAEIGLLDQSKPGLCHIHHSRFRNIYYTPLSWITSFSYNHSFTGGRALRFEHNEIFDCAWNSTGGVVFFVSGPSAFNPPELDKIRCSGVRIANNKVHLGAPAAPTRSGGGTATGHITTGFNFGGWLTNLEFDDNQWLLDDSAIAAGNTFNSAGAWQVQSNGADCFVRRNRFRGAVLAPGVVSGLSLISSTADQFMGLWQDNILTVDGATQEWPLTSDGFATYADGAVLFPKFPVWYVRGPGTTVTSVSAITHPERWAPGQIIEIRADNEGTPLYIAAESATHTFATVRLLTPRTRLQIRRGSTSNTTDSPHWYEHAYFSSDELTADFIAPTAPPMPAIESYAPGIQMWGVHVCHLASGTYGYLINAPDEDGLRVQVYLPAGGILRHNSAIAPAGAVGTPKLLLIGGVDYTFASAGESHFVVDNDTGLAVEVLRIDGTTVFGSNSVPTARQVIAGAGLTGGGDLSADRTFNVVAGDSSVVVNANDIQVAAAIQTGAAAGATAVQPARNLTAGAGLTGGGTLAADRTFNVVANADGSIVVNADDIQVGVINDTQHGARAGGTLHPVVTGSVAGFMSAADKTKLDTVSAGAGVPTTRQVIAGAGLTGGGALSGDVTVNVVANADGSIVVAADDIKVGVLATDAQHGVRGGGTQHAVATTSVPGFMSDTDKTKLDGIGAGAAALTAVAPVNVTKAAAAVGVATTAARSDHKHDISTAAVLDVGTANTEGIATTVARSDHVHNLPFNSITTVAPGAGQSKGYVIAASITNIASLSGLAQGADGAALSTPGVRVLLTAQTTLTQNGVWVVQSGVWTRPTDFVTGSDFALSYVFVQGGVTYPKTLWYCTTSGAVDSNNQTWELFPTFRVLNFSIPGALQSKGFVAAVSTANIASLSGAAQTADGVSLVASTRVLLTAQTTATQNGIWVAQTGAWTRPTDFATGSDASLTHVFVQGGIANSGTGWLCTTGGLVDSNNLTWSLFTSILSSTTPPNVDKSAAAVGVATKAARADHKHDISTAAPVAGAVVAAGVAAEGTATTIARSDHIHAVSVGTPVDIGNNNAAGSAATLTRSDHSHNLPFSAVAAVAPGPVRLKDPVKAVSTINRALSGLATSVDGIALDTDGYRVLLVAQSTGNQNGIWLVHAGAWTRPIDYASLSDAASSLVVVQQGGTYANTLWTCTNASLTSVDSVSTTWAQIPSAAVQAGAAAGATAVQPARQVIAGAGLTGGGALSGDVTVNVVANADGSIVVAADDIKVGVLATDAQHGVRGGGTQHAVVVAGGAAGFQSGADKTKLDNMPVIVTSVTGFATAAGGVQATNPVGVTTTLTPGGFTSAGNLRLVATFMLDIQATTTATGGHGMGFDLSDPGAGDGFYVFTWELASHVTSDGSNDCGFIYQKGSFKRTGGNAIGVYTPTAIVIGGNGVGPTTLVASNVGASAIFTITPSLSETRTIDWAGRLEIRKYTFT